MGVRRRSWLDLTCAPGILYWCCRVTEVNPSVAKNKRHLRKGWRLCLSLDLRYTDEEYWPLDNVKSFRRIVQRIGDETAGMMAKMHEIRLPDSDWGLLVELLNSVEDEYWEIADVATFRRIAFKIHHATGCGLTPDEARLLNAEVGNEQ